ncbi:hypothetical protein Aph02nite_77230 [Actinoplanes philippinensis]|nr:hypothetical protein Aph02nite_77230 [Actinoplanes philippinensis]
MRCGGAEAAFVAGVVLGSATRCTDVVGGAVGVVFGSATCWAGAVGGAVGVVFGSAARWAGAVVGVVGVVCGSAARWTGAVAGEAASAVGCTGLGDPGPVFGAATVVWPETGAVVRSGDRGARCTEPESGAPRPNRR